MVRRPMTMNTDRNMTPGNLTSIRTIRTSGDDAGVVA
jgi:hypothetical protein